MTDEIKKCLKMYFLKTEFMQKIWVFLGMDPFDGFTPYCYISMLFYNI